MLQSFFVLPSQYEDLARDEVISISKSYDPKTKPRLESRLVILNPKCHGRKLQVEQHLSEILETL